MLQLAGQGLATHQMHAVEVQFFGCADLVDGHDVGVFQACGILRFVVEAFGEVRRCPVRRQHLDRHIAVQTDLVGAIDRAHAAFAEQFVQFVVAELAMFGMRQIEAQRFIFARVSLGGWVGDERG